MTPSIQIGESKKHVFVGDHGFHAIHEKPTCHCYTLRSEPTHQNTNSARLTWCRRPPLGCAGGSCTHLKKLLKCEPFYMECFWRRIIRISSFLFEAVCLNSTTICPHFCGSRISPKSFAVHRFHKNQQCCLKAVTRPS